MKKKSELSLETLEQLGSAKGISTEVIVDIIKESFKFAYTKKLDEEYGIYKSKVSKKNAPKVKLSDALVRTELDLKKGVVICSTIDESMYQIPIPSVFGTGSYHGQSFQLYYVNLGENAKERIDNFLSEKN